MSQTPSAAKRSSLPCKDDGVNGSSKRPRHATRAQTPHSLGGVKGYGVVIGTCDSGKEKQATKELITLLDESWSRLHPVDDATTESGETSTVSIEDQIKRQVQELKSSKTKAFTAVSSDLRGVVVVCVLDKTLDIVSITAELFSDVRKTKVRRSRFLIRAVPLATTCYGDAESLVGIAKPLVDEAFETLREPVKWAVSLTRRNSGMQRQQVVDVFGGLVPNVHTVSLSEPEMVIVVEAMRGIIGVSVMKAATKVACSDFNLRRLQDEVCK